MTHIFRQAVACVLLDWPVLQIAVDNSFGGLFSKEKAEWLIEVTAEYIQQTEHGEYYISSYVHETIHSF